MNPKEKLDIAGRHVAEAEAAVARQKQLIKELERDGHSAKGSHILLRLFEDALQNAKDSLATMKFRAGEDS